MNHPPDRETAPDRLVLVTGVDGTLCDGEPAERERLAEQLIRRPGRSVIVATGRSLASLEPLLAGAPIPPPDFIIADVGATVVHGRTRKPVQPIQRELERGWPGREPVLAAMAKFDFLRPQEVPQERRCSFLTEEKRINEPLVETIEALGCGAFFSSGRFLDVLPREASKGDSLLRLVDLEDLDPGAIVVAGDSWNDLSLFHTGFRGILVGNAEPDLHEAVQDHAGLYRARQAGAGGILEGLAHFGYGEPWPAS